MYCIDYIILYIDNIYLFVMFHVFLSVPSLSLCLSIRLSVYLRSVHLSICLSVCLSLYLSLYPSIYPSIHPSIYPSIHPSIYLSISWIRTSASYADYKQKWCWCLQVCQDERSKVCMFDTKSVITRLLSQASRRFQGSVASLVIDTPYFVYNVCQILQD